MPNLAGTASAAESTWVFAARSALCCLDHELYLQMFFKCVAARGFGRHHLQKNPLQQQWPCTSRERQGKDWEGNAEVILLWKRKNCRTVLNLVVLLSKFTEP